MSEVAIRNSSPATIISNILLSPPTTKETSSASRIGAFDSQDVTECLANSNVLITNNEQYSHPNRFIPPGRQESNLSAAKIVPKRRLSYSSEEIDAKKKPMIGRDESYPEELNNLIKPLFCELCKSKLNSFKTAITHYQSKVHDKNLNAWLALNYTDKGLEAPAIKRFYRGDIGRNGPDAYHCECCDLKLTSKLHAEQHYNGRRHHAVLMNKSKPSGSGYYDTEGKWVRSCTNTASSTPEGVGDRRFGIGESFRLEPSVEDSSEGKNTEKKKETTKKKSQQESSKISSESLTCKVCNITVTSMMHMNCHLEGAKHRKKLKSCGEQSIDGIVQPENTILFSLNEKEISPTDVSMYRTPSGSFYCKTCDLNMVNESVLLQHLQGKKHIKKMSQTSLADTSVVK